MKLSTDRILTTHVGSLPRPDDLFALMSDRMDGKPIDEPGQMRLIKNDPKYNEQWPRALVPYKRIYGIDELSLAWSP